MTELKTDARLLKTAVTGSDGALMITVSGGRSSAMMARHIQINEKYANYEKVFDELNFI